MNAETILNAYTLKEYIDNDERVILLNKLEKEMMDDEEVQALSYRKDLMNTYYNDALKIYPKDSKEVAAALKRLYEAKKALDEHPKVVAYLKAFQSVRLLMEEINTILYKEFNENLCPRKQNRWESSRVNIVTA